MLATLTLSYQGLVCRVRGRRTSKVARCCSMTSSSYYTFPGTTSQAPRNEFPTESLPRPRPPTRKTSKDLPLPISIPVNPPPQSQRDAEGRSLAGRKKPLKINLDLALYRARQKRIEAQHALDSNDRVRLLRETESMLRKCLEMDPEDGRTYVTLGKLLVQQRRYDEALALYEAGSAATGGTNAHIWTAWAYLAERRGNISLARRLYDAALVASPSHAAAYHGWGLLEKKEGNFGAARDIWTKGINATKDIPNPYLYQSLAVLAADLDRPEEARRWFNAGTKTVLGSNSTALWQAWALLEQRRGSDPEAVRFLYRRALQASPRSRYTFLSWALWEKEMGNFAEARKLFKSGSYLNATDAAILQAWALMEEQLGDRGAARRLFQRASEADPSHLYVWQAWGCMEQRDGNLDAARELFQQGIWAAPPRDRDTTLIFQAWAILEREAGNAELARELFKCAVKADPSSEPSWLAWAEMEEELGFFERANELRTYNMQERQQVTTPGSFSTLPRSERSSLLTPFFEAINKWFNRYEEASKQQDVQTNNPDVAFSDKAT